MFVAVDADDKTTMLDALAVVTQLVSKTKISKLQAMIGSYTLYASGEDVGEVVFQPTPNSRRRVAIVGHHALRDGFCPDCKRGCDYFVAGQNKIGIWCDCAPPKKQPHHAR